MEIDFQKLMSNKSEEELQEYIDNRAKYTIEAFDAAVAELQKRGKIFSEEEVDEFKRELGQRDKKEDEENDNFFESISPVKPVENISAPEYYSPRAVYCFSLLAGVIFGSILLAINCYKAKTKSGMFIVLFFGIVFTAFQIWISTVIKSGHQSVSLMCSLGGMFLNVFCWKKFIGKETEFRAKPIWIPLIIAIIIEVPLLLIVINGNK